MDAMDTAKEALAAGTPLDLESLFKGEMASAMFATMFAGEFVRSGARNYLELGYTARSTDGLSAQVCVATTGKKSYVITASHGKPSRTFRRYWMPAMTRFTSIATPSWWTDYQPGTGRR